MFGFNYIKIPPSHYVMQYSGGKLVRSGAGLAFFYFQPSTSLVVIPVASADVPFIFNEISGDFQAVTLQGQLTFASKSRKSWRSCSITPWLAGQRNTSPKTRKNCPSA